jgi:DNA repair protein RecO (recombination protein O)
MLVEAFTRQHGRITLVARGVKNKKKGNAALLQPFAPLLTSWWMRGELGTLRHTELHRQPFWLTGNRLVSGLYVNELLNRLLGKHVPYSELFDYYADVIQHLATDNIMEVTKTLRLFEKFLMMQLGYGLTLDQDVFTGSAITADDYYAFEPTIGCYKMQTVRADYTEANLYKGSSLLAFHQEQFDNMDQLQDAKRLMRKVLSSHLGGKPLYSRALWS